MHEEIIRYINNARNYGLNDTDIKQHLLDAGWEVGEVNEAFSVVEDFNRRVLESQAHSFTPAIEVRTRVSDEAHLAQTAALKGSHAGRKKILLGAAAAVVAFLIFAYLFLFQGLTVLGYSAFGILLSKAETTAFQSNQKTWEISYQDPESFSSGPLGNGLGPVELKELKFTASNNSFRDQKGSLEGQTSLEADNGGLPYILNLNYIHVNEELYLKLEEKSGVSPAASFLSTFFGVQASGNWLKLKYSGDAGEVGQRLGASEIIKELVKQGIIRPKLAGIEKVRDNFAFHYKLEIDKARLVEAVLAQIPSNDSAPTQMASSDERDAVRAILEKIEIKDLEIWIGLTDWKLKKFKAGASAPSLASLTEASIKNYTQNLARANDDKRVSDIKQVRNSLELFYNDEKGYPEGILGVPQGLSPKYLPQWPESAAPSGNCGNYYNTYWYKHQGEPRTSSKGTKIYPSYTLTFCLGFDTAGYTAGLGIASPTGITTTVACPDQENPCFLPESRQAKYQETFSSLINKIKFTGGLSFTYTPEAGDPSRVIIPPEGAVDIK